MDFEEISLVGLHRIGLSQDRDKWRVLVNAIVKIRDP
jgi:hypothetical protein